jgi:hypothetical protein
VSNSRRILQGPPSVVVGIALQYQLMDVLHLTTRRAVVDGVVCAAAALLFAAFRHPELREQFNQLLEAEIVSGMRMPDYKTMFAHEVRRKGIYADDIAALCALFNRTSPIRSRLSRDFSSGADIASILSTVIRFPILSREAFVLLREAGAVGVLIRLLTAVDSKAGSVRGPIVAEDCVADCARSFTLLDLFVVQMLPSPLLLLR